MLAFILNLARRSAALALMVCLGLGLRANSAQACATCGCGDPTLTALGAERPYQNRVRVGLDFRYRTDAIGEAFRNQIRIKEQRLGIFGAWAPSSRLFLQIDMPVLRRTVRYPNLAETTTIALGDFELRAKLFVAQERIFAPRHLFALVFGFKLPTAPRQTTVGGAQVPSEAQPGTGSFDPILGVSYAFVTRPWAFYGSILASAPLRSTAAFRASTSLRGTTAVQYQWTSAIALRLGLDTRIDGKSFENATPERDSGGFVAFVSPEVLLNPTADLVFFGAIRYPVASSLQGFHDEGPVASLGVGYDL
jgi:hypothetical protein